MNYNANDSEKKDIDKHIWAIGGGKGGVGKSLVTVCLGFWLTKLGNRVVLLDADLGGANLHTLLGIKYPRYSLNDFLNKEISKLDEAVIDTPIDGLKLISGASDLLNLANPKFAQKQKIINHLNQLEVDYILLDLGAGSSFNVLDFFLISDEKIVVLVPQFPSIQNAYGFIKNALFRNFLKLFPHDSLPYSIIRDTMSKKNEKKTKNTVTELLREIEEIDESAEEKLRNFLDGFKPRLITNMIKQPKDREAANIVKIVSEKYLSIDAIDIGCIYFDSHIEKSINRLTDVINPDFSSEMLQGSYEVVMQMMALHRKDSKVSYSGFAKQV
ncbi:MAG: P-loop NTPase [Thermodesulfobacteriota bacterium]|nr:P-loop NTPase [Thermodesulfobacteriota bacterium]